MKNLFFIFLLSFTIIACGDDDSCSASDWVGSYTGTTDCDEDNEVISAVITEGENGSINITSDGETQNFVPADCTVVEELDTGLGIVTSTYTLDGDNITLSLTGTVFGEVIDCSGLLTK